MKLKHLELTNFRIFEQATFDFQSGMNLLVGINGAGKSSVLDALRILFSEILISHVEKGSAPLPFADEDFTVGHYNLTGKLHFTGGGSYSISQYRYAASTGHGGGWADISYPKMPGTVSELPSAVYFSPRRSIPTYREPSKQASASDWAAARARALSHRELQTDEILAQGRLDDPREPNMQASVSGQAAAYAGALSHRELQVPEFAAWILTQRRFSREDADPIATRRLQALQSAATQFLENYTRLEAVDGEKTKTISLLDDDENPLDIRQLSDGERGLLALILDLARRLSLANPKLEDPLRDGEAVVLIDELDLHLHPGWQRTIVEKLTTTFPNCQFIATTHSPQIIGECDPAGLILLTKEDGKVVVTQDGHQGFGLDSSWILEHLMGTAPRNVSVQMQINRVEDAIEEGNLQLAREHLADLRQTLHGDDGEVVRLEASINNLEALADEVDSETP